MSGVSRGLLIAAGSACVALGVIGAFVPLLPTTPFVLLAAACFARSSPRMLRWLYENRLFGEYIRHWREGRGIPLRQKIIAIALIWIGIGATVIWFTSILWVKILLLAIAALVTLHLLWMPTFQREQPSGDGVTDTRPMR